MDSVSQIKEKLNIVDVVGSYVSLKKSGKNYKSTCPFHSEKTASFMVSPELQIYKCFGCNESGDMFSFIEKIEGVDFSRALEILAEKAGIKLENREYDPGSRKKKTIFLINSITSKFYHYLLTKHEIGKPGLDYLTDKRKLKPQTIDEFMIGYAPDRFDTLYKYLSKKGFSDEDLLSSGVCISSHSGTGLLDKFRGRIIFPFTATDGKVVGFNGRTIFNKEPKYINTSETLVFIKNSFLYGLDKAKVEIKTKGAIIVEGQMDVISAHQAGIKNVVASTGTALTENQLKLLARYTTNITFCFDSDSAGVGAVLRGIDMAQKQDLNITAAIIPEGYKDLDELVTKDTFIAQEVFNNTVPVYDFFIAAAMKKHDPRTALGKKRIMDEITPRFATLTNKVLLDHYIKEVSEELSLDEKTVYDVFKGYIKSDKIGGFSRDSRNDKPQDAVETGGLGGQSGDKLAIGLEPDGNLPLPMPFNSYEFYYLAMLLHAGIDTMQEHVYKLAPADFYDNLASQIYTRLKEYLHNTQNGFNINHFIEGFEPEMREPLQRLYLWDLAEISEDNGLLKKELESLSQRIKNASIKKQLADLSQRLKLAEKQGNSQELNDLTNKINELSKNLAMAG